MDIFERDDGTTTAETVHRREEFRQIVADVQELPETQRTALLLREIDALSYDQIAEAMDTTVPSVKSLLVRARVSLAEASEARLLTCEEVRLELGQVAEGLAQELAARPPPPEELRALPHLPQRAAHHHQGAGRDLPDRPAGDPARSSASPSSASAAARAAGGAAATGGGGLAAGGAGLAAGAGVPPPAAPPAARSPPASAPSPPRPRPAWPPPRS